MDGIRKAYVLGLRAGRSHLGRIAADIARSWGYTVVEHPPKQTGAPAETKTPDTAAEAGGN